MNESRNDLIQWINDLLSLNVTKIEQLGTGAVYCQIMDSIYGTVLFSHQRGCSLAQGEIRRQSRVYVHSKL